MLELLAGGAVAIAILLFVLEPLVRPAPPTSPEDDEPAPLEESESPKIQALLALKEVEFDRATGKLTEEDYQHLKSRYEGAALHAMQAEEDASAAVPVAVAPPADALIAEARRGLGTVCPHCGPRPESGAVFCSGCGRSLAP